MKITRFNHAAVNIHGKVDEARSSTPSCSGSRSADPAARAPAAAEGRDPGVLARAQQLPGARDRRGDEGRAARADRPARLVVRRDLDETVAELDARGIEMRVLGEGRQRIVWVADPAGNTVEFQQDPNC
jgi:catechol 2,3-dioxygenase-like lactoylglutathione lyase family enzyme